MISEHIRLLLHQNDCVVVPGLGGFIINHLPAGYDEKENRFYPSRALPFFNKQLQSNDGLLAAALVKSENYDYPFAVKEIQRFVEIVKDNLEAKREYAMPGLGEFQRNHEGQITFFPDKESNTAIDTYGLDSLAIQPLIKPSQMQRKALAPIRKKSRTWITMAASLCIIAAGAIWINHSVQTPFGAQWSALNPFDQSETVTPTANQEENQAVVAPSKTKQTDITTTTPVASETETTEEIEAPYSPEEEELPQTSTIQGTDSVYYIVVGAFSNERYAARYERSLKKSGFSACSYSEGEGALIRVCAEKHSKRFEAQERLSFIQGEANPKAWILAIAKEIP